MLSQYELKPLVGERINVIFIVADSGVVIHKNSIAGKLRGRPCEHNFNDYDLFAVKDTRGNAILYIDLIRWTSDGRFMVTLEPVNVLGKSTTPILNITFNAS